MDMEILLIKEWGEYSYGDIATVGWGLYETLINKKFGIPITCLEEVTDKQNLVEHCRGLEKQINEIDDKNSDLFFENQDLKIENRELKRAKEKIKELEKSLNYNNKMLTNYKNK